MEWKEYPKHKPKRGSQVLILEEGYSIYGDYYSRITVAYYDVLPHRSRRKIGFIESVAYRLGNPSAWVYDQVTKWMWLPDKPAKPISLREFRRRWPLSAGDKQMLRETPVPPPLKKVKWPYG